MIKQRLLIKDLYENPIFKSKFWRDETVFNENTPLLKKNIEDSLIKYTRFSHCYEDFTEYENNCQNKNFPQVVGISGNSWNHWLTVIQENQRYKIIDSSGAPKDCYYRDEIEWFPPRKQVDCVYAGVMRQSPLANSCGLWALTYCVSSFLMPNYPEWIWKQCTVETINFDPDDCYQWTFLYTNPIVEFQIYQNDINVYNYYVNHLS